jgi:hypothetical protein
MAKSMNALQATVDASRMGMSPGRRSQQAFGKLSDLAQALK